MPCFSFMDTTEALVRKKTRFGNKKPPLCKGRCRTNVRRRDCKTKSIAKQSLRHGKPCHLPLHKGGFFSSLGKRLDKISLKMFTNRKKCAIMKLRRKLNNTTLPC